MSPNVTRRGFLQTVASVAIAAPVAANVGTGEAAPSNPAPIPYLRAPGRTGLQGRTSLQLAKIITRCLAAPRTHAAYITRRFPTLVHVVKPALFRIIHDTPLHGVEWSAVNMELRFPNSSRLSLHHAETYEDGCRLKSYYFETIASDATLDTDVEALVRSRLSPDSSHGLDPLWIDYFPTSSAMRT